MTQEVYGVEEVKCDVCEKTERIEFDTSDPKESPSLEWQLKDLGWQVENHEGQGMTHICPTCLGISENGWKEEHMNEHESAEWTNPDNPDYLLSINREYPISREAEFFTERDENDNLVEKEKYHIVCQADEYDKTVWGWDEALSRAREFMSRNPS